MPIDGVFILKRNSNVIIDIFTFMSSGLLSFYLSIFVYSDFFWINHVFLIIPDEANPLIAPIPFFMVISVTTVYFGFLNLKALRCLRPDIYFLIVRVLLCTEAFLAATLASSH